ELKAANVEVYSLGAGGHLPSPYLLSRCVQLARGVEADVMHCWLYHACLLGAFAAPKAGIPRLIWGVRSANAGLHGYRLSTRFVVGVCDRLSASPAAIVANSQASRTLHAKWGYSDMRVIPNGLDVSQFKPDSSARSSVRKELGVAEDVVLVGLFARYSP